jgi:hypothetical protein
MRRAPVCVAIAFIALFAIAAVAQNGIGVYGGGTTNVTSLLASSTIIASGSVTSSGNIYAGSGTAGLGCLSLWDTAAAHNGGICMPASGVNQFWNLWTTAGTNGYATITDGVGDLLWVPISYIHGSLAASQMTPLSGTAPSVACNTTSEPGAGTSGTPTCTAAGGTDVSGILTIVTATAPAATSTLATITFAGTHATAPGNCQISWVGVPLSAGQTPYITTSGEPTTTSWYITTGTTALGASTTAKVAYTCI